VLQETYGVLVYQEQVLQIAKRSPATPSGKPTCSAAMGKKQAMKGRANANACRGAHRARASRQKKIEKIFHLMAQFSLRAFNKSTLRPHMRCSRSILRT